MPSPATTRRRRELEATDLAIDTYKNLTSRELATIVLRQREHYGEALLKISRLARANGTSQRKSGNTYVASVFDDLAEAALSLREQYGLSSGPIAQDGRLPTRPGPWR